MVPAEAGVSKGETPIWEAGQGTPFIIAMDIWCGAISYRSRLWVTYLGDLIMIGLIALMAGILEVTPPYERLINLSDPSIKFPFTLNEIVPGRYLLVSKCKLSF